MLFSLTPLLDRKISSVKRLHHILSVLVRHGFEELVVQSGVAGWAQERFGVKISDQVTEGEPEREPEARVREAIEELGPTFVKLGQLLSTRPDIVSQPLMEELRKLQSECTPEPFSEMKARIERELQRSLEGVFATIEEDPLAAGSLAQVHRATLHDGQVIAVKILRPGIEEKVEADVEILKTLARFFEKHFERLPIKLTAAAEEFGRELRREIDLLHEGKATERLRRYFLDDASVKFPKVYSEKSTRGVLCLELIEGQPLAKVDFTEISQNIREKAVRNAGRAIFRQCFELGFFHGDPHPGNIVVLEEGVVCFLDCGLTGTIDRHTSEELATLVSGVADGDVDKVVRSIVRLSGAEPTLINSRTLRNETWQIMLRFQQGTLGEVNIESVTSDFFEMLRRHEVICPSDIVFLIKALVTIEGVAGRLYPEYDVVEHIRPYLETLAEQRYHPRALLHRFRRALVNYGEIVEDLPNELRDLLTLVKTNTFRINLEHHKLEQVTRTISHTATSISTALLAAALFVGSSILIMGERVSGDTGVYTIVGSVGFIGGVVLLLIILLNNYRFPR